MKNVLVMPVGMTPQVVTETIYWYGVVSTEKIEFDELQLITTRPGADLVREKLCGEGGALASLGREYRIAVPTLGEENICVLGGMSPLPDIRSGADNDVMADEMTALVRKLCADRERRIFFSVAGGRKTMGTYLALLATFFGREEQGDRLSHVLVSPEFERPLVDDEGRSFFYPPRQARNYHPIHDVNQQISSAACRIDLAEIPIVFLGRFVKANKRNKFNEVVEDLRRNIGRSQEQPEVLVKVQEGILVIDGKAVHDLAPGQFALYAGVLWGRKLGLGADAGEPGQLSHGDWFRQPEFVLAYLEIYDKVRPLAGKVADELQIIDYPDVDGDWAYSKFAELRTRINDELALSGVPGLSNLMLQNTGVSGTPRYGVKLAPEKIRFDWPGDTPQGESYLAGDLREKDLNRLENLSSEVVQRRACKK